MHITQCFNIDKTEKDDWFNAILNVDTPLFVDPFLIFNEKKGFWSDSHDLIIKHFEKAFLLVAEGNLKSNSLSYKKALSILLFTEPNEFCLGYTANGVSGAGGGFGLAQSVASAITEAIKRGLKHPKHFEKLGVMNRGIGPDLISDITLTVLKSRLIQYTQQIAKRHKIQLDKHKVYASSFNELRKRWITAEVELPTNPFSEKPIIFVPERFLDDLPELNSDDWWNYYESVQLRDDLNYEIMGKVDKDTIIKAARENPELVRKWTLEKESEKTSSYDFDKDPLGLIKWLKAANEFASKNPLTITPPKNSSEFFDIINSVTNYFKLFIEEQGGWQLLWNDNKEEKREIAPQLLFRGIASNYCKANDISLDAEVNLGRGPVDFKFSTGYSKRVHLEVKKVHNGKFWNGIQYQLPSYMKSDEVEDGWFLAILYRDEGISEKRVKDLPDIVSKVSSDRNLNLHYSLVDARPKVSASNIKEE